MASPTEKKTETSHRALILMGVSFLVMLAIIYFGLNYFLRREAPPSPKPSVSGSPTNPSDIDAELGEEPARDVIDPVCKKAVNTKTAPYHYDFLGSRFYFCSEDCLVAFINEPIKYSDARIKVKINIKTPASPDNLVPLPEEVPTEETNIPAEKAPGGEEETPEEETKSTDESLPPKKPNKLEGKSEDKTPLDSTPELPSVKQGEEKGGMIDDLPVETPSSKNLPSTKVKYKEPPSTEKTQSAPNEKNTKPSTKALPPNAVKSSPSPGLKLSSPGTKSSTKGQGSEQVEKAPSEIELPQGILDRRPKPTPEESPKLKATPIKPPEKGIENI